MSDNDNYVEIINGVPIYFPLTPYDVQKRFMSKVLECLQKGVNGVLESPAGTGKTLGLLCSSLAWLRLRREQGCGTARIVYSSRTHSQLEQAARELQRTAYGQAGVAGMVSSQELSLQPDLAPYCHKMEEVMNSAADIVFIPHHFVLHPFLRTQGGLSLNNCAVLFDDGHSVATACQEVLSAQISSREIAACVAHLTQVTSELEPHSDDLSAQDLTELEAVCVALQQALDEVHLDTAISGPDRGKKTGKVFPATYICELLEKSGVLPDRVATTLDSLIALSERVTSRDGSSSEGGRAVLRLSGFVGTVVCGTRQFVNIAQLDLNFRVYIEPEVKDQRQTGGKVLNFWCFNPSLAMKSLQQQGVTSIILTSGTLSPLNSIVEEIGIPISVLHVNPHIIKPSQVKVISVSQGPGGHSLSSNFSNRDNPDYLNALGRVVRDLCGVVPGGMLVVFPSYSLMRAATSCWETSGVRREIDQQKRLFEEPQWREDLVPVMADYCRAVEADGSPGAVLLAVMRGKVVEEVDLAAAQCRAVVVVGVPYLPSLNPRITLKRQVLRTNPQGLKEQVWYEMQASQAVNQAVGRLLRRPDDYGVVLLCDSRYQHQGVVRGLSTWLQPCISHCEESEAACRRVSEFFEKIMSEEEKKVKHQEIMNRIFRQTPQ